MGIAAIPLAPVLYREHFLWLVVLRPTKEVLLAGGFFARQGRVEIPELVVAAIPLAVFGVWNLFALGRSYAKEIEACDVPGMGGRILPPDRIQRLQRILRNKGPRIITIGRFAAFPSSLVAAAAGGLRMPVRKFLIADILGAIGSILEVIAAGYLLGAAYKRAGPAITVVGFVLLAGGTVLLGRYLRRESPEGDG